MEPDKNKMGLKMCSPSLKVTFYRLEIPNILCKQNCVITDLSLVDKISLQLIVGVLQIVEFAILPVSTLGVLCHSLLYRIQPLLETLHCVHGDEELIQYPVSTYEILTVPVILDIFLNARNI